MGVGAEVTLSREGMRWPKAGAAGACWAEAGKAAADEASEAEVWAEDEECGKEES